MSNPSSWETSNPSKYNYDSSKINTMKNQVDEVVDVMRSNVQKVMEREERLQDLDSRADRLNQGANEFKTTSRKVKRKMWWRNLKMILALSCVLIVLIVIIIVATVGFPSGGDEQVAVAADSEESNLLHSTIAPSHDGGTNPKLRLVRAIFQ